MGVDCQIYLPPQTRVSDVAEVVGTLLGHPTEFKDRGRYSSCEVEGVEVKNASVATLAEILFEDKKGVVYKTLNYHFEAGEVPGAESGGWRCLLPRSTPLWCAVAKRLVDFFGGKALFQDVSEEIGRAALPRFHAYPEDGEPWTRFERDKSLVKPLIIEEIEDARSVAAYDDAETMIHVLDNLPWLDLKRLKGKER